MKINEVPIGSRIFIGNGKDKYEAAVIAKNHTTGNKDLTLLAWKEGQKTYHSTWNVKQYTHNPSSVGCTKETYDKLNGFDKAIWISSGNLNMTDEIEIIKDQKTLSPLPLLIGGIILSSLALSKNRISNGKENSA